MLVSFDLVECWCALCTS